MASDRRALSGCAKSPIQANAEDTAPEFRRRSKACSCKDGASKGSSENRICAVVQLPEIIVEIFCFDRPIVRKRPFPSTAYRPSGQVLRDQSARGGELVAKKLELRDSNVRRGMTISSSTGRIENAAVPGRPADSTP
jgi:hypothetical protein